MTSDPNQLTDDIRLRPVVVADAATLARAYGRNREHLTPWDPQRDEEFFTEAGQAKLLRHVEEARRDRRTERWALVHASGEIVGSVALSAIELGAFQNGRLGYWVDGTLAGRGLATAAVSRVCTIAAELIGLHRIEAGTLLENAGSRRVLAKCGFEEFGIAPRYLRINGAWQDHRMFQRILFDEEG